MNDTAESHPDEKESLLQKHNIKDSSRFISYRMIPSKMCFFLHDAIKGIYLSYLIIFLTSIGLDVNEAGVIGGVRLIVSLLITPILGWISDRTKRPDIVFVTMCIVFACTHVPLPWMAASLKSSHLSPFQSTLFYVMLVLVCLSSICINPLRGFIDSFVMKIISDESVNKDNFSTQALFGSIGSIIFYLISGFLIQAYHPNNLSEYTTIFYLALPVTLLLVPVGLLTAIQAQRVEIAKLDDDGIQHKKKTTLSRIFLQSRNMAYISTVTVCGICYFGYTSFIFQLMKDLMHSGSIIMGISYALTGATEVMFFLYAERAIETIGGPLRCLLVVLLLNAFCFIVVSFIKNSWLVLPIQMIQGIIFSLFWVSAATYTKEIACDDVYSSVFCFVINCYGNVGAFLSVFCGGFIYKHYGGDVLFNFIGGLSTLWFIIMVIYLCMDKRAALKKENV